MPSVLCVAGPTACGKTRLGVLLAKRYGGEVVSMDSMQVYRGLVIGTAAPTGEEREGVPHHMVGVVSPAESFSVARFAQMADACIQDILGRGRLPVLVGGSGLYLDAVLTGHGFAPGESGGEVRRALRERLDRQGAEALMEELRQVDPEAAGRIHLSDRKRLVRALEVYYETGKTITEHNRESRERPPRYAAATVALAYRERADLYAAIDKRVDGMMAAGLLDEVRSLERMGLPAGATALQAIGYKELLPALRGEIALRDAVEEVKLRSRQYAKRQLTWLRRKPDIHWILWEKERNFAAALQDATNYLSALGVQCP